MKISESCFDHYLNAFNKKTLHPSLLKTYNNFPDDISDLKNIIFYGPKGVGKYTQMLSSIKKYSPSELKYEKKISVTYNKDIYFFKISDIHYEIDMSLIGCHSKLLWNEIYNHITDILLSKPNKTGIIVCKYFHEIHNDLLDIFYSYMQKMNKQMIDLKFIFISESISFIPDNILNCCYVLNIPRPSRVLYNSCLGIKIDKHIELRKITNIHNIENKFDIINPIENICNKIINYIIINTNTNENENENNENIEKNDFYILREYLYDIFIYNLNPYDCVWYILSSIINIKNISYNDSKKILKKTYTFLQYYNNNYRPIYHFENFIIYIIVYIQNNNKKVNI
jgi:hypothetical protein